VRLDRIGLQRQAALEQCLGLLGALGAQRRLAQQQVEGGVRLVVRLDGLKQLVGLLVATVGDQLPAARHVRRGGQRQAMRCQQAGEQEHLPNAVAQFHVARSHFVPTCLLTRG
jgi:hypothetical protein